MNNLILNEINLHKNTINAVSENLIPIIEKACLKVIETLKNSKKLLLFGNGGSAADAQHIAAELTGRYKIDRKGLPAIALTTDTSALTSIGNDFGFASIFERQVEALASSGDLLLGISTSGNSENVFNAFVKGKEIGCFNLGLTGNNGGKLNNVCDLNIIVPSDNTPRIQEVHILIGHIICQYVESNLIA